MELNRGLHGIAFTLILSLKDVIFYICGLFMYLKFSKKNCISVWVMFLLSASGLTILNFDSMNFTLFYIVGPIIIILCLFKFIFKRKCLLNNFQLKVLLWAIVSIIISLSMPNYRIISILHFLFYALVAVSMLSIINFSKSFLVSLTSLVIYANFFNVIIAIGLYQVGILNIPTFFGTYFENGMMRYMGFATEPSYLAMESTVCMLAYIRCGLMNVSGNCSIYNRFLVLVYLITLILSKTTFGLISILFFGIAWIRNRLILNKSVTFYCLFVPICLVAIIFVIHIARTYFFDYRYVSRIIKMIELFNNTNTIREFVENLSFVDGSTWYRIGPFFLALDEINCLSFVSLFGHGIGSDVEYYTYLIQSETVIRGGFWQSVLYNQGIIGLVIFFIMLLIHCRGIGFCNFVYLCICFTNCSFSTQAFWFVLIVLYSVARISVNSLKNQKNSI